MMTDEVGVTGKWNWFQRNGTSYGRCRLHYIGYQDLERGEVGDTITHVARPCDKAIAGFEEVKPMVFAGVYSD